MTRDPCTVPMVTAAVARSHQQGGDGHLDADSTQYTRNTQKSRWVWAGPAGAPSHTYAGRSSRMSAVVDRGSKSRFFLTLCLGDVGVPGPKRPFLVSYS